MEHETQFIDSVVIVGGGSAGWLTAGLIAAHHKSHLPNRLKVTLIESPGTPTIGVGEGTWPTMRATLKKLGISETDFIRECDATFKQGAKFSKWTTGAEDDYYYHPLMLPEAFGNLDLAEYWQASLSHKRQSSSFSDTVCFQEAICEAGLAPKAITMAEYGGAANYAYHLDSGKFVPFLKKHCVENLGVVHILDDVTGTKKKDNNDIKYLETKNSGQLPGDLFVDCTGFASLLLGKEYDVKFKDMSDVLFIDTALATHVPYDSEDAPIASHTISTAQSAGWIWDIGLPSRRGVGHVFSSRHISEDAAMNELRRYIGPSVDDVDIRKIPITSGFREKFWINNCVAVGLSAGFLEPLEASAFVLIELSAQMISEQLPVSRCVMDITAKSFNDVFKYRWERIIDFLKLHYVLTKRSDSEFWRDNVDPSTIPESLQNQLELWKFRTPNDWDFDSKHEVFPAASYQYVLYGMGFKQDLSRQLGSPSGSEEVHDALRKIEAVKSTALRGLPTNRELIDKIQMYGFGSI